VLGSAPPEVDGKQVPIGAGGALIGRSSDCDIVIPAQEVSRRHAQVVPQDGGWTLVDLGSTNGVRLNRRPLAAPARLAPGDVIEIGSVELTFEVG
jgi:pSer/pThr/pTyr-binding forkhead associated (FHA) protein